jgi:hypothetical protein
MNPFSSPNMSAQKWKNNINTRFRREAAGEVKRILFANNANSPAPDTASAAHKPLLAKTITALSPTQTPYISKPSPYLLKSPINYRTITIPSNTTPKAPELRGGYRKTRKNSRKLTRRFVKPKILRY